MGKLSLNVNKKLLQSELKKENIHLTLRDLTNLKSQMTARDGDNLMATLDYLVTTESKC